MKTPEDEAFDDIAKRQGHWGGGFMAKKAMAADKLQEPPSEWAGIKAILDEYGLQAIDFVADFKAALAQPAQEPVAWWNDMSGVIDLNVSGRGKPLYTAPSQPTQELVAYVMGTHGGRFVVAPLNPAMVLPVGMALYAGPA